MTNYELGVFDIGIRRQSEDTIIFGGPFIEYGKGLIDSDGSLKFYDGTGTSWNYHITKHPPMDIDQVAKRLTDTKPIGVASPRETQTYNIKGNNITVNYGRPYRRGREIFGGIVPYDSVWRTGAGTHTSITFEKDIKLGEHILPKGKYSIYTVPGRDGWELIFNTDFSRWPTDPDRSKDLVTVNMSVEKTTDEREQLAIEITETNKGGRISVAWDDVVLHADFQAL